METQTGTPLSILSGDRLAFVALGSNLGDSQRNVLFAVERLRSWSDARILLSSLWSTSPVDCPPRSLPFVNAAAGMVARPGETPESLLAKMQDLEREFGRRSKQVMNEERPLDLDLIAFGSELRATRELTLPHPRAAVRRFVLQPLSEIAPGLILPGQRQTVSQLLFSLPEDPMMKRLA